jgi:iron complex transport system substrate-binding protein
LAVFLNLSLAPKNSEEIMKIFNRFKLISKLAAVAVLALTGCAQATPEAAPTESAAAIAPVSTFPLTLTDNIDREVTLKSEPERVVSLLPSNTEILFAVGAGEQVVGVTSYCNYPEEATTREQVGGITSKSLNVESIVALEPDLVLASGSQSEIIPILEESGLTVIVLEPATFDDIFANIELVGQVTGHTHEATALVNELRQRVETVVATVSAADTQPTVFYEVWHDPLMTGGPNTFIGQLITMAGGKSIFADVEEDWPQVSTEVVVERNPAVILGPDSHGDELTPEKITTRAGWENIAAVQNGQIYLLNGDAVSRPGPRLVDMLEETARDLHPDLFK